MTLLNGKKRLEMNGKLVDTNILIYLSKKKLELEKIAAPGVILSISVITYMEVLGFKFGNNSEKYIIEQLCKSFLFNLFSKAYSHLVSSYEIK
jgi:hypothetical protein